VGNAANPGRPGPVRGARGVRDRGQADPARGGADTGAGGCAAGAGDAAAAVRARGAEPALAVGHLHVPLAPLPAGLHGGVSRRPQPLPGVLLAGAPPEGRARARGVRARGGRLRGASGAAHRPGAPVHGLARRDCLRAGAPPARHPTREEPAAAPADARQDRALLEDALGRVSVADRVRRLCRSRPAAGSLRQALQLPASAPGALGPGARGPLLPGRPAGARGDREVGGGKRAPARAGEAAAKAVLPGGAARRPGPVDRRRGGPPARAGRRGGKHDRAAEGG
jgi:hypothetical protein